ncbi:protocatechuate 3,4-dioxygenase [Aurantiacibacter gilvus]|uniref:Protocatechuate 3,4-dioxygenase n=1 Tax=Aurantiacibacter gilvus TaxID=3139141 RepID=A0ABU9IFI4_9SPHN
MAVISFGAMTSHGPTLSTPPENWTDRVAVDRQRNHHYKGETLSFDELVHRRAGTGLEQQIELASRREKSDACHRAIDTLADRFEAAKPDIAIIFGNDQRELFLEDVTPSLTLFTGDTVWDRPATPDQASRMPPGIHLSEMGHSPPEYREYPAHPDLALHLVDAVRKAGFDPAVSKRLPEPPGHWSSGAPHALGFVYRQIMRDRVIPHVPIILNTFFPPNQPSAARCFALGQAIRRAIASWAGEERIAVIGSGGMSHFVIDEQLDEQIVGAIIGRDGAALTAIDEALLQSGTSELKTWIAAAGCLFETDLTPELVDYQTCYRSLAGSGTANGFMSWN